MPERIPEISRHEIFGTKLDDQVEIFQTSSSSQKGIKSGGNPSSGLMINTEKSLAVKNDEPVSDKPLESVLNYQMKISNSSWSLNEEEDDDSQETYNESHGVITLTKEDATAAVVSLKMISPESRVVDEIGSKGMDSVETDEIISYDSFDDASSSSNVSLSESVIKKFISESLFPWKTHSRLSSNKTQKDPSKKEQNNDRDSKKKVRPSYEAKSDHAPAAYILGTSSVELSKNETSFSKSSSIIIEDKDYGTTVSLKKSEKLCPSKFATSGRRLASRRNTSKLKLNSSTTSSPSGAGVHSMFQKVKKCSVVLTNIDHLIKKKLNADHGNKNLDKQERTSMSAEVKECSAALSNIDHLLKNKPNDNCTNKKKPKKQDRIKKKKRQVRKSRSQRNATVKNEHIMNKLPVGGKRRREPDSSSSDEDSRSCHKKNFVRIPILAEIKSKRLPDGTLRIISVKEHFLDGTIVSLPLPSVVNVRSNGHNIIQNIPDDSSSVSSLDLLADRTIEVDRKTRSGQVKEKSTGRHSEPVTSHQREQEGTSVRIRRPKRRNACDTCGKVYWYQASFEKHLVQHEQEKALCRSSEELVDTDISNIIPGNNQKDSKNEKVESGQPECDATHSSSSSRGIGSQQSFSGVVNDGKDTESHESE